MSTTTYINCCKCCNCLTPCCPSSFPLPTLTATLSGGTGGCFCLNGATASLVPGLPPGTYAGGPAPTGCGGCNFHASVSCDNATATWTLTGFLAPVVLPITGVFTCSPWQVVFNITGIEECCTGGVTLTLTGGGPCCTPAPMLVFASIKDKGIFTLSKKNEFTWEHPTEDIKLVKQNDKWFINDKEIPAKSVSPLYLENNEITVIE